ncbi:MAG TPA: chemotaxis protein CheB, partial [bacterium]|nr:chemotaxis protein CheB [bacterium]
MSQIRVLIADDSPTAVDIIATILETDDDIRIVGKAVNGREAVAMAETLRPDVITVDIQMPIMNGLDAIKQIMAHYPTPILVITSSTDASIAFQALSFGALEVVEKPSLELDFHARKYEEFIRKVKLIARVKVITHISGKMVDVKTVSDTSDFLLVIGIVASTGGPRALASILGSLPKNLSAPVLVVQHIADGFTDGLIQWLADVSPLRVKSAEQGESLARGTVYIAPNGKHLEIGAQNKIVLSE